jgi:hypothetical protein
MAFMIFKVSLRLTIRQRLFMIFLKIIDSMSILAVVVNPFNRVDNRNYGFSSFDLSKSRR